MSAVLTGFADVDGDSLTYQYQWFRNGGAIPLANGRSLNLAQLEGGVAAGDVLRVEANALDGHGGTSPAASGSTTVAGGNGHPVASYGFEEAAGALASDQYGGNDGTITGADRVEQRPLRARALLRGRRRHRQGRRRLVAAPGQRR